MPAGMWPARSSSWTAATRSREDPVIHIAGGVRPAADGRGIEPVEVLIEGERILEVAPRLDHPPDAQLVDARGRLVVPGLVNGHMHAHNNLFRGLVGEWTLEDFLNHIP